MTAIASRWRRLTPLHAGIAGATVLALLAIWPLFGGRLLPGNDVTGHLVRTAVGIDLLRHGHLDGWNPRFSLGYQQSLFYGPGFTWIVAAVRAVTFGQLSDAGAMKVIAALSYLLIPAATAFVARSVGLGSRASGFAAMTALLASNPFGVGFDGLFHLGLVPQQVAAVLFLVLLGAVVHLLRAPSRRWMVITTVTLTLLVLTHLISVVLLLLVLALLVPAVLWHDELSITALRAPATAAAIAVGLTAFWWAPLLVHRDLHGPVATWPTPPFGTRVSDVVQGHILFTSLGATAVLIGLAWGFVRVGQGKPYAGIVAAGPIVVLAIAHWAHHGLNNELTTQLANRGLGLIGILLTLPLAAALAEASRRLGAWMAGGAFVIAAVAVVLASNSLAHDNHFLHETATPTPALRAAAAVLRRAVPQHGRFVTMRAKSEEPRTTGIVQPDRWLAWKSGRATLNVFPLELSSVPEASAQVDQLGTIAPARSAAALRRYGVSDVVTLTERDRTLLLQDASFRLVWSQGELGVLAVEQPDDQPRPSALVTTVSPSTGSLVSAGIDRFTLVVTPEASTVATVAVAWSPKWHASVNHRAVPVRHSRDGLIEVDLPAGTSRVDLRFRADTADAIGRLLSALTVLGGIGYGWHRRRRTAPVR